MPIEWISVKADNIDGAAERIIDFLEHTNKAGNVIYFHGWNGWGASAVLKEVAKRLTSSSGWADTGTAGGLEKIINIDFLRWQSKRSLQKRIAEELKLPNQVMALFDQFDEKDDFDGVDQSARGVIPYVRLAIMNKLSACRFLVVLYNGSGRYIDLWEVGVPVIGDLGKRVLWTSRGRFWHHVTEGHEEKKDVEELAGLSDIAISAVLSGYDEENATELDIMRHLLYTEAEEVAKCIGVPEPDMSPKIVMECILYRALIGNDHNISWESHASNCWVCDGIIQDATVSSISAWEIGEALQRNMNLDLLNCCVKMICKMLELWRRMDHWVSVTSQNTREVQVPSQATSFFWRGGRLEAGMFEHSDRTSSLRVMHLSHCAFSFSSPPFLSCSNLRFLLLDHCKDMDAQDGGEENNSFHHHSHHSQEDSGAWSQNLWVLELSYTDWYWLLSKEMLDLMSDLRELNVKGVGNQSMSHLHRCSGPGSNSRKLLKLRVVAESYKDDGHDGAGGDGIQQVSPMVASFPDLSSWHILKTIVLDGCGDLEIIGSDALPLSLELFSLTSNDTTKIKSISFRGCTQLKSLLLRGLFDSLEELDMSGTAIKTLDLSATQAEGLKRLVLLGCEKLHAILWPQEKKYIYLEVLRIDTSTLAEWDREDKSYKQEATSSDNTSVGWSSSATLCDNSRALTGLDWYISLRDPRIFGSLLYLRHTNRLHIEISSAGGHKGSTNQGVNSDGGGGGGGRQQVQAVNLQKPTGSNLFYDDDIISTFGSNSQSGGGASNGDVFEASVVRNMWIWHCPPIPTDDDWAHCYIIIKDDEKHVDSKQGTTTRQLPRATTMPCFVNKDAKTLHLHDSLSITCLPGPTPATETRLDWSVLKWCRLERCPNLEGVVFTAPSPRQDGNDIFEYLETFWASQLSKARYIWDWSISAFRPGEDSFEHLMFLHLDYCPRLVHVLPLYTANTNGCCKLKTLEIVCCSDLREVFPSDLESHQQEPRKFPRLKRIHLYELPKLQRICGHRMLAPNLKTVKIRGCWGLKRLPAVRAEAESSKEESSEDIMPPSMVDLDCEKEWWDSLEWDGEEAGHHPSHYKPTYHYRTRHTAKSVLCRVPLLCRVLYWGTRLKFSLPCARV